jgi:hypothetical protein
MFRSLSGKIPLCGAHFPEESASIRSYFRSICCNLHETDLQEAIQIMTTLRDIANLSGVSTATVSRALNSHPQVTEKTRAKVLRAAQSLGYSAAPTETHTDIQRIAVVYPGTGLDRHALALRQRGPPRRQRVHGRDTTSRSRSSISGVRLSADESYASWFAARGISAAVMRSDDSTMHVCERIGADGVPGRHARRTPRDRSGVSYVSAERSKAASAESDRAPDLARPPAASPSA